MNELSLSYFRYSRFCQNCNGINAYDEVQSSPVYIYINIHVSKYLPNFSASTNAPIIYVFLSIFMFFQCTSLSFQIVCKWKHLTCHFAMETSRRDANCNIVLLWFRARECFHPWIHNNSRFPELLLSSTAPKHEWWQDAVDMMMTWWKDCP